MGMSLLSYCLQFDFGRRECSCSRRRPTVPKLLPIIIIVVALLNSFTRRESEIFLVFSARKLDNLWQALPSLGAKAKARRSLRKVKSTRRRNDKRGGLMNAVRCDIMGFFDGFKEPGHFTDSRGHALRVTEA